MKSTLCSSIISRLHRFFRRPVLPSIPGIKGCNPHLVRAARTYIPFVLYPASSAIVACAAWYFLYSPKVIFLAAFITAALALYQGMDDRKWFDAYTYYLTQKHSALLSNRMIIQFLEDEFL